MTDAATVKMDLAVIAAGRALVLAEMATPRDPQAVADARAALEAARAARWPSA